MILGLLAFTSYYYWLKYPLILDKLFRLKDDRLKAKLSKISTLNFNARAFTIHKLMQKRHNQDFIGGGNPALLKNYLRAKRYWFWSLAPLVVITVITQIEQIYEIMFEREQFQEKIDNSWIQQTFESLF